jgi:hypothetical protein
MLVEVVAAALKLLLVPPLPLRTLHTQSQLAQVVLAACHSLILVAMELVQRLLVKLLLEVAVVRPQPQVMKLVSMEHQVVALALLTLSIVLVVPQLVAVRMVAVQEQAYLHGEAEAEVGPLPAVKVILLAVAALAIQALYKLDPHYTMLLAVVVAQVAVVVLLLEDLVWEVMVHKAQRWPHQVPQTQDQVVVVPKVLAILEVLVLLA